MKKTILVAVVFTLVFPAALVVLPIGVPFKALVLLAIEVLIKGKPALTVRKIEDRTFVLSLQAAMCVFLCIVIWALWSVQSNLRDPESPKILEYLVWLFSTLLVRFVYTVATTRFGIANEPQKPGEPS